MEMKVKIYREPENESLILNEEELADYHNLIESLGLKSSVEIDKKENKVPNVYININNSTRKQLRAVCPSSQKIEDYVRTTIPLEVLKVYEFAKNNEMFDYCEVWYNDKAPDPMLVGFKYATEQDKQDSRTWNGVYTLLARWGDEALELPELTKLGYDKIKQSILDQTKETLSICKNVLEDPDVYTRKYIDDRSFPYLSITPSF